MTAKLAQRRLMLQVGWIVRQSEEIDFVPLRNRSQLVESADLLPLVGRIRDSMTEVEDSHNLEGVVGAAGFEPTTSLVFKQGALTAELHAYIRHPHQTEGIRRISMGPITLVKPNGSRFHASTGN